MVDEARASGVRTDPHPIVVYLHAATGPDATERIEAERRRFGYDPADDVAVAGDADTMAGAIRRWVDAGADSVALQPTADDPDPERFIRLIATEIRPLLD